MTSAPVSERGRNLALLTALAVPAAAVVAIAISSVFSRSSDQVGWDLRVAYLPAAEAILDGRSPYDSALAEADIRRAYVYPPQLAEALTPLAALPADVAAFLALLGCLAALVGALALVGVRDLRCYAAIFLWAPTWNAIDTLNVSCLLALGVALCWRWRSTLWPLAAVLGTMLSLKLFVWPLVVWAGIVGRRLAACLAVVVAGLLVLTSWLVVGLDGIREYPSLLERVARQDSYAVAAVLDKVGLGSVGTIAAVGLALVLLVYVYRRRGNAAVSLLIATVAALASSPVVWLHYLVLLIAPIGVLRPRFSVLWLLPVLLWAVPTAESGNGLRPFLPAVVVAALALAVLRPGPPSVVEAS